MVFGKIFRKDKLRKVVESSPEIEGPSNGKVEDEPPPAVQPPPSISQQVQKRLAFEVYRKLLLATDAEEKEDRDIICSEVFADITGELNSAARESTGTLYSRWYEVLGPYFCKMTADSERLLAVCRQLWGQPFTAPIFTLLLHQWLLVHPEAGGADQRLKHLNILVSGARQLFIGDVETGNAAFRPLYSFVAEQVVLMQPPIRLGELPAPGRESILALVSSFLPYYGTPLELRAALRTFPSPSQPPPDCEPSPGEGADFLISCIVDLLGKEVRAEAAVLRYLKALMALKDCPQLASVRTSTRIRLQGEIYALTQPGGPRYASRAVNQVAFTALDALFPHGRRTRRLINLAFRFLHPQEWPWVWWDTYGVALRAGVATAAAGCRAVGAALQRAASWRPPLLTWQQQQQQRPHGK